MSRLRATTFLYADHRSRGFGLHVEVERRNGERRVLVGVVPASADTPATFTVLTTSDQISELIAMLTSAAQRLREPADDESSPAPPRRIAVDAPRPPGVPRGRTSPT